ncbi:hypothetical protein A3Q56_07948, partial [Intoshia linei]
MIKPESSEFLVGVEVNEGKLHKAFHNKTKDADKKSSLITKINNYISLNIEIDYAINPIKQWNIFKESMPMLFQIAIIILIIPCFQVSVERSFNILKTIDNCTIDKRNFKCLIDTGAVSSFLPSVFKANKPSYKKFTDVNGNPIINKRTLKTKIFVKSLNNSFIHNFVVSNVSKPILSINIFVNHNIDILQNPTSLRNSLSSQSINFIKDKLTISFDPCDPQLNSKIDLNMAYLSKSFEETIKQFKYVFSNKQGRCKNYIHDIDIKDECKPVVGHCYSPPMHKREIVA